MEQINLKEIIVDVSAPEWDDLTHTLGERCTLQDIVDWVEVILIDNRLFIAALGENGVKYRISATPTVEIVADDDCYQSDLCD